MWQESRRNKPKAKFKSIKRTQLFCSFQITEISNCVVCPPILVRWESASLINDVHFYLQAVHSLLLRELIISAPETLNEDFVLKNKSTIQSLLPDKLKLILTTGHLTWPSFEVEAVYFVVFNYTLDLFFVSSLP